MRENVLERKLVIAVRALGGLCEKWTSSTVGWPDRIVLFPGGRIGFVEVKAPGKKPRMIQVYRAEQLRALGFRCYVLDDEKQIGGILDGIQTSRVPKSGN